MIPGLVLLLSCQLAGETLSRGLGLPVPGPVLGLVFLLLGLLAYGRLRRVGAESVAETGVGWVAGGLLASLALLATLATLAAGSVTAIASAVAIAAAFGVPRGVLVSLAPKSVTAGVAMAISAGLGGEPALTAVLVIATGLVGALMVTLLMNALGIRDYAARGFAVGLASHGIGTARAFTVDAVAGTSSSIAVGLNAAVTAIVAPLLRRLL